MLARQALATMLLARPALATMLLARQALATMLPQLRCRLPPSPTAQLGLLTLVGLGAIWGSSLFLLGRSFLSSGHPIHFDAESGTREAASSSFHQILYCMSCLLVRYMALITSCTFLSSFLASLLTCLVHR